MTKYMGEEMALRMKGKKAEFLIDTTKGKDMKKGFTLIVCFSRAWCVRNFFAAFYHLQIDMKNCHLLVIDNSDNVILQHELLKKLTDGKPALKDVFYTCRLYKTWRMGGKELVTMENAEWNVGKLPYIYEMHKDFLRLTTTANFVLLEDDTLPPYGYDRRLGIRGRPDAVMYMLEQLEKNPRAAVYTAIETGRSSVAYAKTRLGVHYLKREKNRVIWRLSPSQHLRGVHKMDACGWYCCAARKEPWRKAFEGMDKYIEDVPRFAMDVVHTNNIIKNGWDILADFSLWCAHMNYTPDGIIFWGKRQVRPSLDLWLPDWQVYAQGVLLTAPPCKAILDRIQKQMDSGKRDFTWKS